MKGSFMLGLTNVTCAIIAITVAVFTFRQVFFKFQWSSKTIKNVILIVCTAVTFSMSSLAIAEGLDARELRREVEADMEYSRIHNAPINLDSEIKKVNRQVDKAYRYAEVGYVSLILTVLIYGNVIKDSKKTAPGERWNLEKVKDKA
ncbi:MAG: hypothetical protein Q8930_17600 [Bacillota bacterium]|nr:hypothetical protein [Bacillota bacterium]